MVIKSHFYRDTQVEQEIADFLDTNFYSTEVKKFYRYREKQDQESGKDIHMEWKNRGRIIVDEKSMSSAKYINKFLSTFAFEIQNTNSGKIGWLLDDTKVTDYYLLIYVWAKEPYNVPINVKKLYCILIERGELLRYLTKEGWDKESMLEKCSNAKQDGLEKAIDKDGPNVHEFIYFFLSPDLHEKPFNIIIRREKLEQLSIARFWVHPDNKIEYI